MDYEMNRKLRQTTIIEWFLQIYLAGRLSSPLFTRSVQSQALNIFIPILYIPQLLAQEVTYSCAVAGW